MLRIAFIGGGRIADLHAAAYRRCPRARLVALCDRDPRVLRRRKAEWGLERTYGRVEDLLADGGVDAVEVLAPHATHRDLVLAAAAAGKHVSVQKPMAVSLEDCDAMIAAASRAGVVLKVFENFVFHPPYRRAKALLEAGGIGRPLAARFRIGACTGGWRVPLSSWLWRLRESELGRGPTVFDDGWHKLSLAIELFGPVEEVTGFVGRTFGLVDCPAALAWRHAGGVLGHLDASLTPGLVLDTRYYPADERVEVAGTQGELFVDGCTARVEGGAPLRVRARGRVEAHEDLGDDWQLSFDACAADFVEAVLDGRPPRLSGERGREVHAFALACLRAGRGETVRIPSPSPQDRFYSRGLGKEMPSQAALLWRALRGSRCQDLLALARALARRRPGRRGAVGVPQQFVARLRAPAGALEEAGARAIREAERLLGPVAERRSLGSGGARVLLLRHERGGQAVIELLEGPGFESRFERIGWEGYSVAEEPAQSAL